MGLLSGVSIVKKKEQQDTRENASQREAWMTTPLTRPHSSTTEQNIRANASPQDETTVPARAPGLTARNVPNDTVDGVGIGMNIGKAPGSSPAAVVGDGGASWRMKALMRRGEAPARAGVDMFAHKRAARERRREHDVARERSEGGGEMMMMRRGGETRSFFGRRDSGDPAGRNNSNAGGTGDARRKSRGDDERYRRKDESARRRSDTEEKKKKEKEAVVVMEPRIDMAKISVVHVRADVQRPVETKDERRIDMKNDSSGALARAAMPGTVTAGGAVAGAAGSAMTSSAATAAVATGAAAEKDKNNMSAAARLRAKLMGRADEPTEVHALPLVGPDGRAAPGAFGRAAPASTSAASAKPRPTHDESGQRLRYFDDDDANASVEDLVRRERYEGVADYDRNFARNVAKKRNFKSAHLDVDDEYDGHAHVQQQLYESGGGGSRRKKGKAEERAKSVSISDYLRLQKANDGCMRCLGSAINRGDKGTSKFVVAASQHSYLLFPPGKEIVPGHCFIVPTDHVTSSRALDEDAWTEMRNFKKSLLRMFAADGMVPFFLETCIHLDNKGPKNHTCVEVIPVPAAMSHKGPLFFKKELQESESEWSVHNAKAVIETGAKGLRGSIPENFPYFHVEFGLQRGFVHVIDDEYSFKRDFGRNIVIGLLGLAHEDAIARRGAASAGHRAKEQAMKAFVDKYRPYDWTAMLEEGGA